MNSIPVLLLWNISNSLATLQQKRFPYRRLAVLNEEASIAFSTAFASIWKVDYLQTAPADYFHLVQLRFEPPFDYRFPIPNGFGINCSFTTKNFISDPFWAIIPFKIIIKTVHRHVWVWNFVICIWLNMIKCLIVSKAIIKKYFYERNDR